MVQKRSWPAVNLKRIREMDLYKLDYCIRGMHLAIPRILYWRDASLNSLFEIYGLRIQLKRPGQQALHDTITVQVFRKLKHREIG